MISELIFGLAPIMIVIVGALLGTVLATELTWFHVQSSTPDGTTAANNTARYTNATRSTAHIIKIIENHVLSAAEAGESGIVQLAKQNTLAQTDGDREFRLEANLQMPESAASADGGITFERTTNFLRGQMKVAFGDSLFQNVAKTTGGIVTTSHWIGLEYEND